MMALRIASEYHARLIAQAAATPQVEICGLLFGSFDRVEGIAAVANVAPEPATRFELDPAALIAAHRNARDGGPKLLGTYHSHPNGRLEPSERDARAAQPDGSVWVIIAGDGLTAWRAVEGGAHHGRFDPIPILQC
jgi:desampylase